MKITPHTQMPTNATQALGQEVQDMQRGQKASSFKLNVTRGPGGFVVTADEIRRLLNTAGASKDYKANAGKYQFKVLTDKSGDKTLTLKQQGLFSRFKGLLRIERGHRERQRAEAAN